MTILTFILWSIGFVAGWILLEIIIYLIKGKK